MAVRAFGVERLMDRFEREGVAAGHRERLKEEHLCHQGKHSTSQRRANE